MTPVSSFRRKILPAISLLCCWIPWSIQAQVDVIALQNDNVELKVTPELGGRVIGFSVPGKPNVLLIGEDNLAHPLKEFSADTGSIPYFGHINWVSPQSEWWTRQSMNPERKKHKAIWPPDPFLIYGKNTVTGRDSNTLSLEGVDSPISGVRFAKKFSLVGERPGTVDLAVTATNIRDSEQAWGIWFNTRVKPSARVYVPVQGSADVRIENYDAQQNIPANFSVADHFFSYRHGAMPTAKKSVRSKAFIQPAQGWMAAFVEGQVFIIQFPLQAREKIHPEQGQVEIYHGYRLGEENGGALELELHAPYLALEPREKMTARERWTVLPYTGGETRAAQIAFLKKLVDKKVIGNF